MMPECPLGPELASKGKALHFVSESHRVVPLWFASPTPYTRPSWALFAHTPQGVDGRDQSPDGREGRRKGVYGRGAQGARWRRVQHQLRFLPLFDALEPKPVSDVLSPNPAPPHPLPPPAGFAKLSEALYIAERNARDEVESRMRMAKQLASKQKQKKEEELRKLAVQVYPFCVFLVWLTSLTAPP